MKRAVLLLALASTSAAAVPPPTSVDERLTGLTRFVDEARMKATVEKLVSFGTRHTLSSQTDPKRGIGAAWNYAEGEFRTLGLETIRTCDTVTGKRIPTPTKVCNIVAIQRGTERPNDMVIITGHIDSRVSDPMDFTRDAPGANDDGSGTAATIEAARVLSKFKFAGTIVYGVLSGEEQGLHGGKILADYAAAQRWNVIANLNNDIIGNSCGSDGVCDDKTVRVFSEGLRWQGGDQIRADVRSLGGENDSPSRNISRFLDRLAERIPEIGLDVMQVWRNDRFGRGGDHTEFLNAGFPAVRLSVAVENYDQQHQDLRTEKGVVYGDTVAAMDFPYLRKVTRLNVAALAAIASAPPPPEPTVEGGVSTDTTINWSSANMADHFLVRWRRTDSANWQYEKPVDETCPIATYHPSSLKEPCRKAVLLHIRVDDWVFGVSSVSADGYESPVASAVPGGAYRPVVAKPKE
ncbi:M28 family peptidase [Sphingomonas jaspsi]|uniref:M28 family peptidase n=1 Tax=Sphingomonas jaspsi TaxID=392409 RepID=UPI0004B65056|nr:M28 family peptidase [Sphingomonas jaspsi]